MVQEAITAVQLGERKEWDNLPLFLTVDEVAALLRVNRKVIYEAVDANTIPGWRKVGERNIRFHRDTLLHWFQQNGQGCETLLSKRRTP